MSQTLTVKLTDRIAQDLTREAADLGLTVDELIEVLADQLLAGQSPIFDLTDEQMAQIRRNMDDPRPSVPHDEVMARARRMLSGEG